MGNVYKKGLVSVVIPTYKRCDKVGRAITSVLSQTYRDIELLLVNDNVPNDRYTQELKETVAPFFCDSRFKLLEQEVHINGAVARNFAIKQAKGEYIAFLDDDDWWEPNKLEEQLSELQQLDAEWGGVSCKMTFYDSQGRFIAKSRKYRDGYIYKDILMLQSDVATGTLLLRRAALDDAGYFDEKLLRNQDLQLLTYFTYKYKLKEVDQYLHCVDVSDAQNRANGDKAIEVKEHFYKSVAPILDELTASERRCIDAIRNFEIGFLYYKDKKYTKAISYCLSMFRSPKALSLCLKKVVDRILTRNV